MIQDVMTERLPVKLRNDELLAKADELARKLHEISQEETDQEAVKASLKDRMKRFEKEADGLAEIVRTKSEMRAVEVWDHQDNARGIVETIRADTGEVIRTRVQTTEERNLKLFPREADPAEEVTRTS